MTYEEEHEMTYEITYSIAFTCTDRGQHKRVRLSTASYWEPVADGEAAWHHSAGGIHSGFPIENPDHQEGVLLPYTWWCGLCTRTPQLTRERMIAIRDAARQAGFNELDVSYLD